MIFQTLLTSTIFLYCSSYVVFSSRLCKNNRQFYLKDKFVPVEKEKTITVKHDHNLFNQLSGFFGQIGSNPKHIDDDDYHWFDGDGMVHGIFFNNNSITYQNKWVQTKRLQVEDKWNKKMYLYFGELKGWQGLINILKYSVMEIFGFLPPARGTANTALFNWNNITYALHEGDMPYQLDIDRSKCNISTVQRLHYPSIKSTTAHPIKDKLRNQVYLYGYNNYDFNYGRFILNTFSKNMTLISQKNFNLINNGMTHDVAFTGNNIIVPDMPLKYDVNLILQGHLPLHFDKENGVTRFGVINVEKQEEPRWFYFDSNFFIFHFSNSYETHNKFIIFACVMDNLYMDDFVDLENVENTEKVIRGKLRLKQIELDKVYSTTKILDNEYMENLPLSFPYNLDFPIKSNTNPNIVYCTIFDSSTGYIRGYTKINTYNFVNSIPSIYLFEDSLYGNSEPQVVTIDNIEYLLSFVNDDKHSYIALIDMDDKVIHKQEIKTRIPPGFHSIYYE